uniref:Uncharacterized protein n=1 Tax=Accipiter nisus TaxID=211598 RepID=A0A8B9MPR1_9AVES
VLSMLCMSLGRPGPKAGGGDAGWERTRWLQEKLRYVRNSLGAGVGGRSAAGTAVSARSEHSGVYPRAENDENARKTSVGDTSAPKIDPPSSCTAVHKLSWATQAPARSLSTAAPHTQTGL